LGASLRKLLGKMHDFKVTTPSKLGIILWLVVIALILPYTWLLSWWYFFSIGIVTSHAHPPVWLWPTTFVGLMGLIGAGTPGSKLWKVSAACVFPLISACMLYVFAHLLGFQDFRPLYKPSSMMGVLLQLGTISFLRSALLAILFCAPIVLIYGRLGKLVAVLAFLPVYIIMLSVDFSWGRSVSIQVFHLSCLWICPPVTLFFGAQFVSTRFGRPKDLEC